MREVNPQDYDLPSSPPCRCGGEMTVSKVDDETDWPIIVYEHPECGRSFGVQVDEENNVKQTEWM